MPDPAPADPSAAPTGASNPAPQRPGGHSRHFRKRGEDAPVDRRSEAQAAETQQRAEEDEIEELTAQLRDLVARKKARENEQRERTEEQHKRERMTRSGSVNLAVMVGPGVEAGSAEDVTAALGDPVKSKPGEVALADPMPRPAPSPNFTGPAPVYYGDSVPPPKEMSPLVWMLPVAALISFGIGYLFGGKAGVPVPSPNSEPAATDPTGAPAAAPASVWKENTVAVLDRALALDRSGDVRGAAKLVGELRQTDPYLPGLTRYAAELQTRLGEFTAPEAELSREISAGRDAAQATYLRAFNLGRQRNFNDCFRLLQSALLKDPFSADALYQMTELLRRQGRFADAVGVGKQALLRVRPGYGLSLETIAVKLRLAQLEAGQVAEVETAWNEAQKTPPLSGDWYLVGAGLALQKRDAAQAAELLGKARALLPKEDFENAVDDYYFRNATVSGPMAEFRLSDAQREQRRQVSWEFFIDP